MYSGASSGGGHAFVCDGADGNGLYHINWGWNGYQDGYFDITILNPERVAPVQIRQLMAITVTVV